MRFCWFLPLLWYWVKNGPVVLVINVVVWKVERDSCWIFNKDEIKLPERWACYCPSGSLLTGRAESPHLEVAVLASRKIRIQSMSKVSKAALKNMKVFILYCAEYEENFSSAKWFIFLEPQKIISLKGGEIYWTATFIRFIGGFQNSSVRIYFYT